MNKYLRIAAWLLFSEIDGFHAETALEEAELEVLDLPEFAGDREADHLSDRAADEIVRRLSRILRETYGLEEAILEALPDALPINYHRVAKIVAVEIYGSRMGLPGLRELN